MPVSFSQLRAFNAVLREGSFSRAAKQLGISQPAVTAQIRQIEQTYGARLFERTGRGAKPTPLARRLFQASEDLARIEEQASEILSASAALATGSLRIVAGAPTPAMALIKAFSSRYPGVTLTTMFGNWSQVFAAIYSRSADVAVITQAPADSTLFIKHYLPQRIVALLPPGHALARSDSVSLQMLARQAMIFRTGESLTQKTVTRRLGELRIAVEPSFTFETREAVYEAVAQGLGVGFMFEQASTRTDAVVRKPIRELPEVFTEDVVCLRSQARRRVVSAFFDLID